MMADTMLVVEPTQDEEVYHEYADRTEKKQTKVDVNESVGSKFGNT